MKNPFLKADAKVIAMYGNTAKVIFRQITRQYDNESGSLRDDVVEIVRDIAISTPSVISEAVADGKNYMIGDMSFDIARSALEAILPESRTPGVETCGIDLQNDRMEVVGRVYRIVKMNPRNMWGNVPSVYRVQLRAN